MTTKVRKGQGSVDLSQAEFRRRAKLDYQGPAFASEKEAVDSVVALQWTRYDESEKYAISKRAGKGFKHPDVEVGIEWIAARAEIAKARREHDRKGGKPRVLVINGSPRSDNTCPGEISKTHRLCERSIHRYRHEGFEVEYLDLSRITSEYGRMIHPCKGCVSTAMPLCHWPCSCYPNHALGQVRDWMNEIYPMWVRAHGIMIITPVHWYAPPSVLKLMMDRMVCADGGNPDYTSTHGKNPKEAKALELKGWNYPRHLEGRHFSVIAHGDTEGVLAVRNGLSNWLRDIGLVSAGNQAELDRYIGYYEPYATSHRALDRDGALLSEVTRAADLLVDAVKSSMKRPRNEADTSGNEAVRNK